MPQKELVKDMTIAELKDLITQCIREEKNIEPNPRLEDAYNQLWTIPPTGYVKHINEGNSTDHI